ncbi:MAG: TIM barrel protein, partial [bacterium]
VYHMSMMGEDVGAAIEAHVSWLGYVHVADMPGRHEPGTGTIDYAGIRATLHRLGYAAPVGMEFSPSGSSEIAAQRALEMFAPPSPGGRP